MGCYNSLIAALAGYDVVIYDLNSENLAKVHDSHREIGRYLSAHLNLEKSLVQAAYSRVETQSSLELALHNVDLVSESIPEILPLKRDVHAQLEQLCGPQTIITSNTSALLISDIETALVAGDRFAALHSYLGAPLMDVVASPRTSTKTIDILMRYSESLGCFALKLEKEYPGYVLNSLLGPLLATAMNLVADGHFNKISVDKAWMGFMQAPMGPFGMIDLFGLNVVRDSWQGKDVHESQQVMKDKIITFLNDYIDRGEQGMKSGQGFYAYPSPEYQQEDFLSDYQEYESIYTLLMASIVLSAIKVVGAGVVSVAVLDQCWRIGTGLSKGPFEMVFEMGVEQYVGVLIYLEQNTELFDEVDLSLAVDFLKSVDTSRGG
jgi:3-hydroxybutyryl-CoA dehydrogenase